MRIVISQPMYLPWIGLFNQLKYAQLFVHFDDVDIPQGRSFITRVQFKTNNGPQWLSVPILRASRNRICDVIIDDTKNWRENHFKTISHLLKSSHYFVDMIGLIKDILFFKTDKLSELNIYGIEKIANYLGLKTRYILSSELDIKQKSSEKILSIIKIFKANCYITGHGARNYLDHPLFESVGVDVNYIDYNILPYDQAFGDFSQHVSIVDAISHTGKNVTNHMVSKLVHWREFLNEK